MKKIFLILFAGGCVCNSYSQEGIYETHKWNFFLHFDPGTTKALDPLNKKDLPYAMESGYRDLNGDLSMDFLIGLDYKERWGGEIGVKMMDILASNTGLQQYYGGLLGNEYISATNNFNNAIVPFFLGCRYNFYLGKFRLIPKLELGYINKYKAFGQTIVSKIPNTNNYTTIEIVPEARRVTFFYPEVEFIRRFDIGGFCIDLGLKACYYTFKRKIDYTFNTSNFYASTPSENFSIKERVHGFTILIVWGFYFR